MRSLRVDLLDRVRSADRDRARTRRDTGLDPRGRVFKDDAFLDGDAELFRGEEERRRVWLAGREARVVGRDGDFGALDASASESAVAVCDRRSKSQLLS